MEPVAALFLGLVQGLTEFLPVSSSGHLVLARALLPEGALSTPGILFEVVVHTATLAAALWFLRREVGLLLASLAPTGNRAGNRAGRALILRLAVASIPAALVGVAFAGPIRSAFSGVGVAAWGLLLTGAVLVSARRRQSPAAAAPGPAGAKPGGIADASPQRFRDALLIGLAQAAAILPGVSRSGMTIVAGRLRGMSADGAARFSFLLSAPVIAGAAALESASALDGNPAAGAGIELAVGFVAAFVAGALALRWVFAWLSRERFHQFGWYCLAVGGFGLGVSGG